MAGWIDFVKITCCADSTELHWLVFMLPTPCSPKWGHIEQVFVLLHGTDLQNQMLMDVQDAQSSLLWVCDVKLLCMQNDEFILSISPVRGYSEGLLSLSTFFFLLYRYSRKPSFGSTILQMLCDTQHYAALHAEHLVDCFGRLLWPWSHLEPGMDWLAQGYCVSAAIIFFQDAKSCVLGNHFISFTSPKCKCLLKK